MAPKVSVVIPVYNVEDYLGQCLDSILLQTLQDIEVICVDDGSTDGSLQILQTYAMLDERLKIIHQENAGPGIARNNGIQHTKGEFIIFLDSDDFFRPEMLEKMVQKAEEDDSDIVICGVSFFDEKTQKDFGEELPDSDFLNLSPITPKNHPNDLFFCEGWMWQKLIKRDLIVKNNLFFPQLNYQEDIPFSYILMALANKISLLSEAFIHYRKNRDGQLTEQINTDADKFCAPWIELWNGLKKYHLDTYYKGAYQNVCWRQLSRTLPSRTAIAKKEALAAFAKLNDIQHVIFDNSKTKISLIICAYNSAEFLPECLDSCLNQTLKEIEIICVDDGSTDNTLKILQEYEKKDDRIKVIHQENQGLSISRNKAMEIATGEYVQFVDADDWIETDTCSSLWIYAKLYGLDMLSFSSIEFKNDTNIEFENPYHTLQWLPERFYPVFTWNHIGNALPQLAVTSPLTMYRQEYLSDQGITWIHKKIAYEDTPFFIESLLSGAHMGALPISFYHKREHSAAITQNMNTNFSDYCWICQYTLKKIHQRMGASSVFIQYLYTFMDKLYRNYKQLDYDIQKKMMPALYKFNFHVIKNYHMALPVEIYTLSKEYTNNKNIKKKLGFYFFNLMAKWHQTGYSINPIHFSLKPLCLSIFGKKILEKNNLYIPKICKKQLPKNQRYILCFDDLFDGITECIDAYTFFQWCQKNNIPSKYVIHPKNPLVQKIRKEKDVIFSDAQTFFMNSADILSKSKYVLTSFGLYKRNRYIKKLPWIKYIFIDHGVEYFKKPFYIETDFDYRLSGFIPTHRTFIKKGLWKNKQINVGLPRWDNLQKKHNKNREIFVFFTWRKSINNTKYFSLYKKRILNFLSSNKLLTLLNKNNITLNVALHHELFTQTNGIDFSKYTNINFIEGTYFPYINRSSLVITDMSSLVFDFMFLDIPAIFYRFDDDIRYPDKRDRLNAKSAKSHDKELYNVFYDEDSVIQKISYYIQNNFILEPEYKKINDSLFWEKENICEHLYEKIKNL